MSWKDTINAIAAKVDWDAIRDECESVRYARVAMAAVEVHGDRNLPRPCSTTVRLLCAEFGL